MKNIIKKISATAMAFTLLGTGTTVAKTINPKFDNSITASASADNCQHYITRTDSGWQSDYVERHWFHTERHEKRVTTEYCYKCHRTIKTYTQKRYREESMESNGRGGYTLSYGPWIYE